MWGGSLRKDAMARQNIGIGIGAVLALLSMWTAYLVNALYGWYKWGDL